MTHPQPTPHTPPSRKKKVEYDAVRRLLKSAIFEEEERLMEQKYTLTEVAAQMGIPRSTWVDIQNGRRQPTNAECVIIAHRYDIAVDEMLRVAGHVDLAGLLAFVERDASEQDKDARKYISDMLRFALANQEWQRLDWRRSLYRERADDALGKADDRARARLYADAVWDWYQLRGKPEQRAARRTDEILATLS